MKLFNKKLELTEKLYEITRDMVNISIEEDTNEFDKCLEKRKEIMDNIDKVNLEIKNIDTLTDKQNHIKLKIKDIMKSVFELDYIMNKKLVEKKSQIKDKITDVDNNLNLRNYKVDKDNVKEKGFFIKFKG